MARKDSAKTARAMAMRIWAPPPVAHPSRTLAVNPSEECPVRPADRSVAGPAYPRLISRRARPRIARSHRGLIVVREEPARVVLELEQTALAAEPVGPTLVLERQQAGRGIDLHPAHRIDLDRHLNLLESL